MAKDLDQLSLKELRAKKRNADVGISNTVYGIGVGGVGVGQAALATKLALKNHEKAPTKTGAFLQRKGIGPKKAALAAGGLAAGAHLVNAGLDAHTGRYLFGDRGNITSRIKEKESMTKSYEAEVGIGSETISKNAFEDENEKRKRVMGQITGAAGVAGGAGAVATGHSLATARSGEADESLGKITRTALKSHKTKAAIAAAAAGLPLSYYAHKRNTGRKGQPWA